MRRFSIVIMLLGSIANLAGVYLNHRGRVEVSRDRASLLVEEKEVLKVVNDALTVSQDAALRQRQAAKMRATAIALCSGGRL